MIESISKSFDGYTILDYNYTETIATILRNQFVDSDLIKQNLIKVHGEASNGDIIFGVEDDAPIKPEHVFLRKAYPRHYKALNFKSIFEKAKRIIFSTRYDSLTLNRLKYGTFRIYKEKTRKPFPPIPPGYKESA